MPEFLAKFYRRIETALGTGVMRRAPVPGSRSLGRIDFGRQRIAARSGTSSQALLLREVARDDLCYPDEIIRPQKLRRGAVVTGFSLISVQYLATIGCKQEGRSRRTA